MINELKYFTDKFGQIYGTEDKCMFVYSLIKMYKPKIMLELGTGLGTVSLWAALAMKENQHGRVVTIDSGEHWNELWQILQNHGYDAPQIYNDYIKDLKNRYNLNQQLIFYQEKIKLNSYIIDPKIDHQKIDILFSDYDHVINTLATLFANVVPMVSDTGVIIIDSAPTSTSSFLYLESLITKLNHDRYVESLYDIADDKNLFESFYTRNKMSHINFIEDKNREQNSFIMIQVSPRDVLPYRRDHLRK